MFGFSLTKLVFTIAAVVAVWYGFKWVGRMKEMRDRQARERVAGGSAERGTKARPATEDMVECATCGAFVAQAGVSACGRDDCPYPA